MDNDDTLEIPYNYCVNVVEQKENYSSLKNGYKTLKNINFKNDDTNENNNNEKGIKKEIEMEKENGKEKEKEKENESQIEKEENEPKEIQDEDLPKINNKSSQNISNNNSEDNKNDNINIDNKINEDQSNNNNNDNNLNNDNKNNNDKINNDNDNDNDNNNNENNKDNNNIDNNNYNDKSNINNNNKNIEDSNNNNNDNSIKNTEDNNNNDIDNSKNQEKTNNDNQININSLLDSNEITKQNFNESNDNKDLTKLSQNNSNSKSKISDDFKIKLNDITKNDIEYQNILPLIQKGSYLTGLPENIYTNSKNQKNNALNKIKYKETEKLLKNLKNKETSLKNEISKVKNKKDRLITVSYGNLYSSLIEKNRNNHQEKELKSLENNLLEKLDEVKNQIKEIYEREEAAKKNRSLLIKDFIKKYENEESPEKLNQKYISKNNNTERTIIRLQKDCNIKNQNRFKDKEKSEFKKMQENEDKDKDKDNDKNELEQKMLYLKQFKDNEKDIIKKRKMKIDEQILKIKDQIKNEKNKVHPLKNYLFYKMANSFEEKERILLTKNKMAKKAQIVGKDELKQLHEKMKEIKMELEKKAKEKAISMKKSWHSRSLILPKYKSPMIKIIEENEKNKIKEEEEKQMKKNKFYEDKKNYFKDMVLLPKINESLRNDIIKKNFSILNLHGKNRVKYIKEELKKIGKMRIDNYNIENKRFKQSNSLSRYNKITNNDKNSHAKISKTDKIVRSPNNNKITKINRISKSNKKIILNKNNSIDLNSKSKKNIIDRNNRINVSKEASTSVKKRVKRNPKEIDYLKEFEKNNKKISYNWDKYMNNDDKDAVNIEIIKSQVEALEDKAERKQELMKMKGGFNSNQKLGNDASNLLFNSIKGKLSVIKALNKDEWDL